MENAMDSKPPTLKQDSGLKDSSILKEKSIWIKKL